MQEALPEADENVPAAHGVAAVAPLTETKEPAGAFVQEALPAADENVPTAHSIADVAPVLET